MLNTVCNNPIARLRIGFLPHSNHV